ncbi:protein RSI-1-like [Phoenix dactylifera]|uniref:Protein RSI-1-like n=1 Tax=Phoenix dactylifera TaxID=42345 RepID=A0A8B7CK80_PHODC|nr:protein RSI-1-like [Phoenix dactylifera]
MASKHSRVSYSLLVLLLLALCFVGSVHAGLKPSDCQPRCEFRCSATSHKKPCMFFCLKCCAQCLCVPPGTYGNKQACPCYNNWKTKEGGSKCP